MLFGVALWSAAPWASSSAQPPPQPTRWLPLLVHMAIEPTSDGANDQPGHAPAPRQPVADGAFMRERVARANQIFAPYRVGFVLQRTVPLPAAHAHLSSRADRNALARYVRPKVIDCFVVASLRDVDEPDRVRRGVHWHASDRQGAHYVIVSILGDRDVFSHELGHYLGNPQHSQTPGNLMSYQRAPGLPFLDPPQQTRLERALRGYLRRGELVLADPPGSP